MSENQDDTHEHSADYELLNTKQAYIEQLVRQLDEAHDETERLRAALAEAEARAEAAEQVVKKNDTYIEHLTMWRDFWLGAAERMSDKHEQHSYAARRVAAYCRELRKTRRSSLQRIDPAEIAAALADAEKLREKRVKWVEWLDEAPERWLDAAAQPPAPATPPGGEE